MKGFSFYRPAKVFFGERAPDYLPELLEKKKIRKVMLVYGGGSVKANGSYAEISGKITAAGAQIVDFSGNTQPLLSRVEEAIALCKKENVDCVIGIGGCTCIDIAKLTAFGAANDDLPAYLAWEKTITGEEPHLLLGAVPTYPEGGSEINETAVVYDSEGSQMTLMGIYADFAILNPRYTYTMDARSTAFAAVVVFVQCGISFLGEKAGITDAVTLGVMKNILAVLPSTLAEPQNYAARSELMWSASMSTLGVMSAGKGESFSWSIFHELDALRKYAGLSYREALTLIFPHWLEAHAAYHPENVKRYFTEVAQIPDDLSLKSVVEQGKRWLLQLYASFGLPTSLTQYGRPLDRPALEKAAREIAAMSELSAEEILRMVEQC